eukprot:scaffold45133_cov30-Tisochrysis_lutea.AAC.4
MKEGRKGGGKEVERKYVRAMTPRTLSRPLPYALSRQSSDISVIHRCNEPSSACRPPPPPCFEQAHFTPINNTQLPSHVELGCYEHAICNPEGGPALRCLHQKEVAGAPTE